MVRLILFLFFICIGASLSYAQDVLNVRTGVHPSYNRLVFDWENAPTYDVKQQGNTLTLAFQESAAVDLESVQSRSLPNIRNVKILSAAGEPLVLSFDIPGKSRFRHFITDTRLVFDVYNPEGKETVAAAANDPVPPPVEKKEEPKEDTAPEPSTETASTEPEESEVPDEVAAETPAIEKEVVSALSDPHVITVTATNTIGMAVYERAGWLWMVVDDPELTVAPQISGDQADLFREFERIDITGGIAYRTLLPKGAMLYGEGGGLLWRVVVTPNERKVKPVVATAEFDDSSRIRGGTLVWPLAGTRKILEVKDPYVGDVVKVATVETSNQFTGPMREFVELEQLHSAVGLAVDPITDDVDLRIIKGGVAATRPGGLALSRARDTVPQQVREQTSSVFDQIGEEDGEQPVLTRIFNFNRWEMGGLKALQENQKILLSTLGPKEPNQKAQDLITLAKLNLANDRSHEALGFLKLAEDTLPGIEASPEYMALRGAANALAGKSDEAIEDLSSPSLNDYGEIDYWKALTLAGLEDWQQAISVMPTVFDVVTAYPQQLRVPVSLTLAEVALRAGRIPLAESLLAMLEGGLDKMIKPHIAAWNYLMGETARQHDDLEKAKEYWKPLTVGKDDFYRAKAGLAMTRLQLEQKEITAAEAVDRLEGLRYAWRGDELETLINYRLGAVYIENGNYLKGLSVLRNAVSMDPTSEMAQEVTDYMTSIFKSLFQEGKLDDVSPLDAVSIYDEFQELTPAGSEGDRFVEVLAERLVEADLLGRASSLLENQVNHRLEGEDAARVSLRLAGIRLLDDKPDGALRSLDVAQSKFDESETMNPARQREIDLLRARALSKIGDTDDSFRLLENMEGDRDISRLKADVAWNAGRWTEAAEAFQDLIIEEDISPRRPLTPYQTDLILNRSIALNLSDDRIGLANLRERYGDAMTQTEKAQLFDLVTRPRQIGLLGNRESVSSLITEVDLFGDFLETYRKIEAEEAAGSN